MKSGCVVKTDQLVVILGDLLANVWISVSTSRVPRHGEEIVSIECANSVNSVRKRILIDHRVWRDGKQVPMCPTQLIIGQIVALNGLM